MYPILTNLSSVHGTIPFSARSAIALPSSQRNRLTDKGSGKEEDTGNPTAVHPSSTLHSTARAVPHNNHVTNPRLNYAPIDSPINSSIKSPTGILLLPYDDGVKDLRFSDIYDPSRGDGGDVGVVGVSVNEEYMRLMAAATAAAVVGDSVDETRDEKGGARDEKGWMYPRSPPPHQSLPLPQPPSQRRDLPPPSSAADDELSLADVYRHIGAGTGIGGGEDEGDGYGVYEENEVYRR